MQKTLKGKEIEEEEGEEALAIWDCGSPLYDSYELVSLSHVIERHLMKLPNSSGSKRFIAPSFSRANNRVTSMLSNQTRKMSMGGRHHRENPRNKMKIKWFSSFLGRFGFQKKRSNTDDIVNETVNVL
ncbi:hypothetical protein F2P56_014514 [Juglans regia]|uniref:Uncharacterized protein n=2 Tax=Juglans regia TaxID=51240 RepID=A0A834CLG6_JUGRE|nr:uncharacterized protein LOC108996440 [Juglans regia]KAF5464439.1 hypothetical protein F2P56_014514 [Juglans regia]